MKMPRKTYAVIAAITAPTILVAGCGGAADPAPSGGGLPDDCSIDALYEAAMQEGTLVRWGGQDPADMKEIYAAFSEEYPGIEIVDAVVNPDEVPTRLLTETGAGSAPPDLFQGRVNFLQPLIDADALDQDPGWAACGVREAIIQEDGGITENIQPWALAYNSDLVGADDLPDTWAELADPQYRGQMSIDPRGFPFDMLALTMEQQEVVNLVTAIQADVAPVITQGGTAGLTQLASGEVSMRPALVPDVAQNQSKGAPIDIKYLNPVMVQNDGVYMPNGIEHPNAAMLFALWYTAEDGGQAITRELSFRDNSEPVGLPDGVEVIAVRTAEDAEAVGQANQEVVQIWAGQ